MKSLQDAINYCLGLNSPVLLHKGENFAQFDCKVYGSFEIMYDYSKKQWEAYKETGKAIAPKKVNLFYFS